MDAQLPDWLARDVLDAHSLDMRQFIDFSQGRLPNGQRIVQAHNSSGLTFSLLPDRGLDLWAAHYNGRPLTWLSPGSPHPAGTREDWLRLFNGGLLTTCGLTHAGPPEVDLISGQPRGLHGRYSFLAADSVGVTGGWGEDGYALTLHGTVHQGGLFQEQLRLARTLHLPLGLPEFTLTDRVTNLSPDAPTPLMVLYHINLGYPLVRAGARLATAYGAVYPRDADAAFGHGTWPDYEAASANYDEQVFFHHVHADESGWSTAALLGQDFGLQLDWDTSRLPYLTQWKNTRQGIYVCGVEPGNCLPEGQTAARIGQRLVLLEPGETHTFRLRLRVLDGETALTAAQAAIVALAEDGQPVAGCNLRDFA